MGNGKVDAGKEDRVVSMKRSADRECRGFLSEIFCSIQGEGLYVGEQQIFLRTAGCSEKCKYCDTEFSKVKTETCVIYKPQRAELPNPLEVREVVGEVVFLSRVFEPVKVVSITGGEPLEQRDFVSGVAAALKEAKFTLYLDTNGIDADGMRMAAPYIDVVAMDLKLPSSLGRECWDEQTECLQLASARNVFVKIVVDENTGGEEIARAVSLIAGVEKSIPLVLQPESGILFSGMQARQRLLSRVIEYQGRAMKILRDVRIIPQCHRILNMR